MRVNPDQEHFLIVPYGLLYSEVTASSLVRISIDLLMVEFIFWLFFFFMAMNKNVGDLAM